MKKGWMLLLAVFVLFGITACGQNGELSVSEVWARPGLTEGNSAVFFQIDNPTSADDRLLRAVSDVAAAVELHQTTMVDGVMKMNMQEFVAVPAGEQLLFKPGDFHVMLIGLVDDLNVGDTFTVTLTFENAGDIVLDVTVREP